MGSERLRSSELILTQLEWALSLNHSRKPTELFD